MAAFGIERFLLTNAAGGIAPSLAVGDFMRITDHINLMGTNPLIGPKDPRLGPRFVDLTEAYDQGLRKALARERLARKRSGSGSL